MCNVCIFCCQLCGDRDLVGQCPNGDDCDGNAYNQLQAAD